MEGKKKKASQKTKKGRNQLVSSSRENIASRSASKQKSSDTTT